MMYQARLDSVKLFYENKEDDCDDMRARTIELTEKVYLSARLEWCSQDAWALLSRYWTTEDFKIKRKRAQEARLNSEDVAQNRGGSRSFSETQQYLV